MALDSADNILIAGDTQSGRWIVGGALTNYQGSTDGFLAKLSPQGKPFWSTYVGKGGKDSCLGVAVDNLDNVVVTGQTDSGDWAKGGADTRYNGGTDAFVAKYGPNGASLWSTYLGGDKQDIGRGVAVDGDGNVLVSGDTYSGRWIVGGYRTNYSNGRDAFVTKLSAAGSNLWSTYLGGWGGEQGGNIKADGQGNAFVTGQTYSSGWVSGGFHTTFNLLQDVFPTNGILGGFDTTANGQPDGFVAKLSPAGGHLWSTCLGGTNREAVKSLALDGAGHVVVCGSTTSTNWVRRGFDLAPNGDVDGFVARILDLSPPCEHPLDSPQPLSPAYGSTNGSYAPVLSWSAVGDAVGYVVRVAYTNASLWPFYISPVLPPELTSFQLPSGAGLVDRQACFWSVQAKADPVRACDSPWSAPCFFTNIINDKSGPSLSINGQQSADFDYANAVYVVRGSASDNVRVDWIVYRWTNSVWQAMPGTNRWSFVAPLIPGSNTVFVLATDKAGNRSSIQTRRTFYQVTNGLILLTNGAGTISRNFSDTNLLVGRGYEITAHPKDNRWLFTGWSGSTNATNNPFKFVMQSNMVLRANFITNQFLALQGTYNGLFYPTQAVQTVSNSGYFTLTLDTGGRYSGRLLMDGLTWPFNGWFNPSNESIVFVKPPVRFMEWLQMPLVLKPHEQALDGWVSNSVFCVPLESDRGVTTWPQAENYTLVADGADRGCDQPGGLWGRSRHSRQETETCP